MRIQYLITDLDWGGAERALLELVIRLDRNRFEPSILSLKSGGAVSAELARRGIPVETAGMRSPVSPRAWVRLLRQVRRNRPQLIHTFLFHANIAGRLAAPLCGSPPVISSVRVEEPRRSHLAWERLTQGWVELETCVSRSTARYMAREARVSRKKLVCVYNGVDPIPPAADRAALRVKLGLPADRPVLLTVGRLDAQKGHGLLLGALAALKAGSDFRAVFAGGGPLEGELKRQVQEAGLANKVQFIGWRSDVADWYRAADLFVLPSRWEGTPNALLEAKAAGLPAVCTAVGGCAEAVREGVDGFLVDPFDSAPMAQAIRLLLEHPDLARRMGEDGRRWVLERFSWDRMAREYQDLYRSLLE